MMALMLVLALGGAEPLSKQSLLGLSFMSPKGWKRSQPDVNTLIWEAPQADGSFAVSVFPVDPRREAKLCVEQLVESLGTNGFAPSTIGAQPASKKITTDFIGEASDAKTEANKVTTTTVVGCDGNTKWVLTWSVKTSQGVRLGPVMKSILDSIAYKKR